MQQVRREYYRQREIVRKHRLMNAFRNMLNLPQLKEINPYSPGVAPVSDGLGSCGMLLAKWPDNRSSCSPVALSCCARGVLVARDVCVCVMRDAWRARCSLDVLVRGTMHHAVIVCLFCCSLPWT